MTKNQNSTREKPRFRFKGKKQNDREDPHIQDIERDILFRRLRKEITRKGYNNQRMGSSDQSGAGLS